MEIFDFWFFVGIAFLSGIGLGFSLGQYAERADPALKGTPMINFREYAHQIGCPGVRNLSDLCVWAYILGYHGKLDHPVLKRQATALNQDTQKKATAFGEDDA